MALHCSRPGDILLESGARTGAQLVAASQKYAPVVQVRSAGLRVLCHKNLACGRVFRTGFALRQVATKLDGFRAESVRSWEGWAGAPEPS